MGAIQAILDNNSTAALYLANNNYHDGKPWYSINWEYGNRLYNWDDQGLIQYKKTIQKLNLNLCIESSICYEPSL